jgi:hypothetical protein
MQTNPLSRLLKRGSRTKCRGVSRRRTFVSANPSALPSTHQIIVMLDHFLFADIPARNFLNNNFHHTHFTATFAAENYTAL